MNSKQRALRTLNFEETDRVPFDLQGREKALMAYFRVDTLEGLYECLGIDFWRIKLPPYIGPKRYVNGMEANYWGVPYACNEGDSSYLCPLREVDTVDEVEAYQWPSAKDFYYDYIERDIDQHEEFCIIGGTWAPIFHNCTWLCGLENTLVNLALKPDVSKAIIRKITDFWIDYTRNVLDKGNGKIDVVYNCNDFGGQNGMLMSPDTWRTFFKPEFKRFYDLIKSYGVKVMQHSCGSIRPIIPDLIEIGADILDPIQVRAKDMEISELASEFGGRIVFHGGVDTQYILPRGSEHEVRAEVRRIIKCFEDKGGYVLCGSQDYIDDIPVENIVAIYDEGAKLQQN